MARSGWSRVTGIDWNNHRCLEPNDACLFYETREHHRPGDDPSSRSFAYSTIMNFKKPPSRKSKPEWYYKEKAIETISGDLSALLRSLDPGSRYLLVPAVTSRCEGDPEYDDRLVRVCQAASEGLGNVDLRELLFARRTVTGSSKGGARDVDAVLRNIGIRPLEQGIATCYVAVLVFDDVLTTGAHFKACQAALLKIFGTTPIVGVFWARTESPAESAAPILNPF